MGMSMALKSYEFVDTLIFLIEGVCRERLQHKIHLTILKCYKENNQPVFFTFQNIRVVLYMSNSIVSGLSRSHAGA